MTKKGPLGKAEEFYVKHHYKTNTVDEIAKELDRPKATIRKRVEACKKEDGEKLSAYRFLAQRQPDFTGADRSNFIDCLPSFFQRLPVSG